jgi:ABC-type polysaccharide/polyol phosphate transport system ATPase subunit
MTITFGADIVQQLATATSQISAGMALPLAFAVSIPVAFYVLRRLVAMIPKNKR